MRTLAVLPIKDLARAKQRLSGLLGDGTRRALAQSMLSDVLAALRQVEGVDEVAVVSGDQTAQTVARGARRLVLPDPEQSGQSPATEIGIAHAITHNFERVLLVPGDTPLLDPGEIDSLLDRAPARGVAIVPDRHRKGTNGLVITPPGSFAPAFGPGSLERHVRMATDAGLEHEVVAVPSLLLDVDTPDDLDQLAAAVEGRHGMAPMTRGTLRQLVRSQARATSPGRMPYIPAA
ncbi:MAG: 2-phospho-L-lactate guanylyltransferase [Thermoleophilaceae bacterium]|nr:2-phospho-L-lactate guanylyltransferase [Thermoleophilaceae bacterium]